MIIHNLKSLSEYFGAVWNGNKTFEIRKNDRNFEEGDFVILQEWRKQPHDWSIDPLHYDEEKWGHSGNIILAEITYVTSYEQKEDYVVLGINIIEKKTLNEYRFRNVKEIPISSTSHT